MTNSRVAVWVQAARPRTLGAGVAPVLIATAMAWDAGGFHWGGALAALSAALLIQIGTNFANDYYDFVKGADTETREGPTRVTQAGLVAPETMRRATLLVFTLLSAPTAFAIYRAGWVYLLIAAVAVALGYLYTAGPFPLAYLGLGDAFAFVFFGPVAVAGAYHVQTLDLPPQVWIASVAPGLLAVALLTVNNLRDVEGDRLAGKKTLPVRFGKAFARMEYFFCIVVSCLVIPLYFYGNTGRRLFALVALLGLAWGAPALRILYGERDGAALNHVLALTGKLLFIYSAAFALAYVL